MKKVRNAALFLVILSMVLSNCLAATASGEASSSLWHVEKPITFTMLFPDVANYPYNPEWLLWKEITARTNVTLDVQTVPSADYSTKVKMMISSGEELPDIISYMGSSLVSQFSTTGRLLPINEYLDLLPNFCKFIEEKGLEDAVASMYELDGNLYRLCGFQQYDGRAQQLSIRSDVFEKNNIKTPETTEELYQALKTLKELYPDSYPLSGNEKIGFLKNILPWFGTSGCEPNANGFAYNREANEWYYESISDQYKEMLLYMRKLMAEGLLDQEVFTQDASQFSTKLYNGQVFAMFQWWSTLGYAATETTKVTGDADVEWIHIPPVEGPTGVRLARPYSAVSTSMGLCIPASAAEKPYFKDLMAFVDSLWFSDEGSALCQWGVEGATYEVIDGKRVFIAGVDIARDFGFWANGAYNISREDFSYTRMTPKTVENYEYMSENNMHYPMDPLLKFTVEEKELQSLMSAALIDYTDQMTLKFIFGEVDIEAEWDNYVKECYAKGLAALEELVKMSWARAN